METARTNSPLPIDEYLAEIRAEVARSGATVVIAEPGAGKTTRIPPALVDDGPVLLLQPRRIAARALARWIAREQGWKIGEEIGWQVRFEKRYGRQTRLLVATEGILTARLKQDPLLEGWRTVILDEIHERSVHVDLALALMKEALAARDDLRLVAMSATIDSDRLSTYLGDCRVIEVPGRQHPIEIEYAPGRGVADVIAERLPTARGNLLCFLPGVREIENVRRAAATVDAHVLPLHGGLSADEQDAALAPSARTKVILATNIAETSLTVDGVTDVIDSGLHRVLRFDPATGLDRLETERIPEASAAQRAGRAGRTSPGRAVRLWDPGEVRAKFREPEIRRIDLSSTLLDILAWGGDPEHFDWMETPPAERLTYALDLLRRLGAIDSGGLTRLGERMHRLPLHPRLGAMLVAAAGSVEAVRGCAILAERDFLPRDWQAPTTNSDLRSRLDRFERAPPSVKEAARQLGRETKAWNAGDGVSLERALLAGFPDRVAKRRVPGEPRLLLASGTGAVLDRASGVREGQYLLCLNVQSPRRDPDGRALTNEARVRMASQIDRDWLEPNLLVKVHRFDQTRRQVLAVEESRYDSLVLNEKKTSPDPEEAERILREWAATGDLGDEFSLHLRRAGVAGMQLRREDLVDRLVRGQTRFVKFDPKRHLTHEERRLLDRFAPETIGVPSGRRIRLDYRADGSVYIAVKLQEMFGLAEGPTVGRDRRAVTIELLAPNGRPVQTTRDLQSFWQTTYADVRRELRGRYPKHPWPEDPWTALPTHRTSRRRS